MGQTRCPTPFFHCLPSNNHACLQECLYKCLLECKNNCLHDLEACSNFWIMQRELHACSNQHEKTFLSDPYLLLEVVKWRGKGFVYLFFYLLLYLISMPPHPTELDSEGYVATPFSVSFHVFQPKRANLTSISEFCQHLLTRQSKRISYASRIRARIHIGGGWEHQFFHVFNENG